MRRALTLLGVLSLLTTLIATVPAVAQRQTRHEIRIVEDEATDSPTFVIGLDEPVRRALLKTWALMFRGLESCARSA